MDEEPGGKFVCRKLPYRYGYDSRQYSAIRVW
jgi:hypothetical protein